MVLTLVWASAVTLTAASVQSTIGFGFAVISVPLLLAVDPSLAPVPQLLLSIPLAAAIVWRERHSIDVAGTKWLLVGLAVGSLLGLLALKGLNDDGARLTVGVAVLTMVLIIRSGWKPTGNTSTLLGGGLASGVMSVLASMGGPPVALIYHPQPGRVTRPTINVVFLAGLLAALVLRIASNEFSSDDVRFTLQLLPSMVVGFWVGGVLLKRVATSTIQRLTLLVAGIGALFLIANVALNAL